MNRLLYALHKWISAIAFVQLAVWTVSGATFAWIAQESIRSKPAEGAHEAELEPPLVPVKDAMDAASDTVGPVRRVELRGTPGGPFYVVKGAAHTARVDARTGRLAPVAAEEAAAIARRDQPSAPPARRVELVSGEPALEYRDCEPAECSLPAYRVALDDTAGTVIYVDAVTGDVTARRNDMWRTYDFFWSLHIMDYRAREDFNHWLIRGASLLAVATVASGIALLLLRATRWVRRRLGRASTTAGGVSRA